MASRTAPTAPTPAFCDNHPESPAVHETDGGGKHSLIHYCESCWRRYLATRPTANGG
jgi:hypothetical protein